MEAILNTGKVPKEVSADADFYSAKAVAELQALGVDPFIAPERIRHGTKLEPASQAGYPGLSAQGPMSRKLRTKRGQEHYALRVAPVFVQIK